MDTLPSTIYLVTIHWPEDPDRGPETFGPFISEYAQQVWVDKCEIVLDGAHFLLHQAAPPFDPAAVFMREFKSKETSQGNGVAPVTILGTTLYPGNRVKIIHMHGRQKYARVTIGTFMEVDGEDMIIDLRPEAGTTRLPIEWFHSITKVGNAVDVVVDEVDKQPNLRR